MLALPSTAVENGWSLSTQGFQKTNDIFDGENRGKNGGRYKLKLLKLQSLASSQVWRQQVLEPEGPKVSVELKPAP